MQISIFGTGYVGLMTGLCLAEIGHEVLCLDASLSKVQKSRQPFVIVANLTVSLENAS